MIINGARRLDDGVKEALVGAFIGGESVTDAARRLGLSRLAVESVVREALVGLATLNRLLQAQATDTGVQTDVQ